MLQPDGRREGDYPTIWRQHDDVNNLNEKTLIHTKKFEINHALKSAA